jgi:microcystin-dependent protein
MAQVKDGLDIIDFRFTVTQNSGEVTISVSDANELVLLPERLFDASTLVIRTATGGGGSVLTPGVDYIFTDEGSLNAYATSVAGVNIYSKLRILNSLYWGSGGGSDVYIESGTLDIYGDNLRAEDLNRLQDQINNFSLGSGGFLIGQIIAYAADSVPVGFLDCDGTAISRTTYSDLFAIIGTTWGVGDGSTTFNLPDLQGAFLRGTGSNDTETMADGNPYAGPSVGSFENDQMQQITGFTVTGVTGVFSTWGGAITGSGGVGIIPATQGGGGNSTISFDSANSTAQGGARTGDETRPFAAGVKYIIKY